MQSGVIVKNLPFKVGQTMTVTGVPDSDCPEFEINIGPDVFTLALHVNPRFNADGDHDTVVLNTFQDLKWGEVVKVESFPFHQGKEFTISIEFTSKEFVVALPDGSPIHFPNRIGANEYSTMNLQGKVGFTSLQIK